MKSSGGLLRTLFNALSPLSGARRGDPKPFEINTVVRNTLYLFNTKLKSSGITVEVAPEIERMRATGHSDDLATALTNLIDNAIYWLKHHDIVRPKIRISARVPEVDKTILEISDNGVGIPDEFLRQVFDVGFSLKPSGTGLGLSIARESISRSGGELSVSDSSQGACFLISLPNVREEK
jgi:signal transduction histidine kinase